ncbi:MAG: hypothetical protein II656_02195, partial [Ruminococcus sp.]|nr:hypothetical protein [Ruminococcus sp.]
MKKAKIVKVKPRVVKVRAVNAEQNEDVKKDISEIQVNKIDAPIDDKSKPAPIKEEIKEAPEAEVKPAPVKEEKKEAPKAEVKSAPVKEEKKETPEAEVKPAPV